MTLPQLVPSPPAAFAGAPDSADRVLAIQGGVPLRGNVTISGSKNAALPILAATLLTRDDVILTNVPDLSDIRTMVELLQALGAEAEFDPAGGQVRVRAAHIATTDAPPHLVERMRASFLVAGPLLARMGSMRASTPGGCQLGVRPVDVDVRGFRQMRSRVDVSDSVISAAVETSRLRGSSIFMDYPSHTGTENLLMAATLAEGRSTIINASCEPEIVALGSMLMRMGARIKGLGSPVITVDGVDRLNGVSEVILPDRLEAGTYAIAAVITGGEVTLDRVVEADMLPVRAKLEEAGAEVWTRGDSMMVRPGSELRAVEVQTLPYPGFPTDLQAAFAVLLTQAQGVSRIKERVFEDRLRYVEQLTLLGANASVERLNAQRLGNEARIVGPTPLIGTDVKAIDIRAGAGMVLAGLIAEGETRVHNIHHLARGYEDLVGKLSSLGAQIEERNVAA
ncbi:MAG: UDP-N-acetylglucosamine 1-carboxyvinyltransferase [Thermomicrobiales bacterium]|nr:UDP-N-acetylglucosamine 1-carboxyvinyltransferase [Thermomicrobiales bacterium]